MILNIVLFCLYSSIIGNYFYFKFIDRKNRFKKWLSSMFYVLLLGSSGVGIYILICVIINFNIL